MNRSKYELRRTIHNLLASENIEDHHLGFVLLKQKNPDWFVFKTEREYNSEVLPKVLLFHLKNWNYVIKTMRLSIWDIRELCDKLYEHE